MVKLMMMSSFLLLMSCSHHPRLADNPLDFPFEKELVKVVQKNPSRSPTSILDDHQTKSPRRVYFSALYYQFLTLGNHLGLVNDLQSCPQFHHDKIETESMVVPKFSMIKINQTEIGDSSFFPEMVFTKRNSIKDHFHKIKDEIDHLCEEGVSDNYFKFDNLVTHYAGKSSFHQKPESMNSLLKIPVFANYYLLKMFQSSQRNTPQHPEEKEMIRMTRAHWFETYVSEARIQREEVIRSKMVQR